MNKGLQLKRPLPRSEELVQSVHAALTPDRRKLLIGIDGADDVGKTSLGAWLAWQLSAAIIHLDLYVKKGAHQLTWRVEELEYIIETRLGIGPAIIEGILLLDALDELRRKPDFLVFVEGQASDRLEHRIVAYNARQHPRARANFIIRGFDEYPKPR